ncbi:MmcQ/YjbR family DNA-binding protein [Streptomyces sp. NPDC059740]|uniref:MmcQ/YjbR family DNA-binding protein n=1 Tax=Streptomyces sp. NPDC059740 TaxID=3346926 RepID=UPI0036688B5B
MIDAEALRAACLEFNGTIEERPFPGNQEITTFKVEGKIFVISALEAVPLTVSLKCEPENAVRLRGRHPQIVPGYHLDKRHWNTVTLDGALPDALVWEMVEDSYDLVVAGLPRSRRLALDWPGER